MTVNWQEVRSARIEGAAQELVRTGTVRTIDDAMRVAKLADEYLDDAMRIGCDLEGRWAVQCAKRALGVS